MQLLGLGVCQFEIRWGRSRDLWRRMPPSSHTYTREITLGVSRTERKTVNTDHGSYCAQRCEEGKECHVFEKLCQLSVRATDPEQTHSSSTPGGRWSPTGGHNSALSISSCRLIPPRLAQQPQKAAPEQLSHCRQQIQQKVCPRCACKGLIACSDDRDSGDFSRGKRPTAGHHRDVVMRLSACSGRVIADVGRYNDD